MLWGLKYPDEDESISKEPCVTLQETLTTCAAGGKSCVRALLLSVVVVSFNFIEFFGALRVC